MFDNYNQLINKQTKISIIGMGYVGLPIAIAFDKKVDVIGFDIDANKIEQLKNNIDVTNEVGSEKLQACNIHFSHNETELKNASIHIVAVPTPINEDTTPDLRPLEKASETIGRTLIKGSLIVFESTVYPGVTEDICVPIIEKVSGLNHGVDFKVGYSPERINPGDKVHRLETITKVVSGMDEDSLDLIANTYELVVEAGIFKAKSIKVAEAAKVIENAQRDINIAFMNELSMIFDRLDINTKDVLEASGTKWNFLKFTPGLVGGHCIGVDPYYLTYKAKQVGYDSKIITNGRSINDSMGQYIAQKTVKLMLQKNMDISNAKVGIFGITFKENCPDIRNTRVIDIIHELEDYGIQTEIYDPYADSTEVKKEFNISLSNLNEPTKLDVAIFAVSHDEFKSYTKLDLSDLFVNPKHSLLIDVKSMYSNLNIDVIQKWSL